MRSKISIALAALILSGCGGGMTMPVDLNQNIVGKPVTDLAPMNDPAGVQHTDIAVFDKNVRLIHEFDLTDMTVIRNLTVDNPDSIHSILFDDSTGLIADFTDAHVSLFDRSSTRYRDPVDISGHPKSAAYDPVHGFLVVYDDQNTVGLIKLDGNGAPSQTWAGGPLLQNDAQLTAGDLMADGTLVLALGDQTLARVDVAQSMAQQKWVFTTVPTTIGKITWIAPVRGSTTQALVMSATTIALISLTDGSILDQHARSFSENVVLESKTKDAHIVWQNASGWTVIYPDAGKLHTRVATSSTNQVLLSSRLCLDQDSWSIVDANSSTSWTYGTKEIEYATRVLRKFRVSDSKGTRPTPIPDQAQIDVSEKYVFAIYPTAPYGYGERISIADGSRVAIKMFNLGYIHN